jgi:hypothetical protein
MRLHRMASLLPFLCLLAGCAGLRRADPTVAVEPTVAAAAAEDTLPPPASADADISPALRPTGTLPASPTFTPTRDYSDPDCNRAAFVVDVTAPDGWETAPGSAFTKTWRLKNTGACAWESGYAVVFDHGDRMGAPDSQALMAPVAPGATGDVSVKLEAPAAEGSYQAFFKLRAPDGSTFGIGKDADTAFWVKITVKAGAEPASALPAVRTVSNRILIEAGQTGEATVNCPGGTVVTGGGFTAGNFGGVVFYPVQSRPSDANGWTATGWNRGLGLDEITVYALCAELPFANTASAEASVSVPGRKTDSVSVDCPAGSFVTGGGFRGNTDSRLYVPENRRSGNGWTVRVNNRENYPIRITVYAACLQGASGRAVSVTGSKEIAANGTGTAEAVCSADAILIGGGWSSADDDLLALASFPGGGKWSVKAVNFHGKAVNLEARGVCLSLT